ncbi:MAG TPA: RNA 2',3'-cyclic phosphodiesterase [Nitrosopumilaceae archaeon]|nr:RNA 2',3'-cyclic phosphodiesterase [Nitrosopumilaceae archaeon]
MRTFVAVEITNQDILNSITNIRSELKIKAKPVSIKNIHFTMQFLGEVSDETSQKIQDGLKSIKFDPFEVSIRGIGAFPKPSFPRVIWIGTDEEGGKKLSELAVKISEKLANLGFKNDKPFKPHVTIFRVKNKIENISNELKQYESYSFGIQKVDEIKFKKSDLTSNGPIYSDLLVVKAKQ